MLAIKIRWPVCKNTPRNICYHSHNETPPAQESTDLARDSATPQPPALGEVGFNRLKPCRHGTMLYNPNDRFVGRSLDLYGEFSEGEAALFGQCVKRRHVVLDIGANVGAHTLFFADAVGPGGRVLAFEPQRLVFQTLCANVALNGLTNVHCRNEAVGAEPGTVRVPVLDPEKEQNFGGLSLAGQREGKTEGEPVPRVTVDGLDLGRCHFMKVDVEGMEVSAIEGAAETIRRHRPLLYVENDRREHSDALIRLIASLDYRLYWHLPRLFNPDNFAANPDNVFGDIISRNMLCVPTESTVKVEKMQPVEMP